ncbi:DUF6572 domain-containing protein, partial [Azospirillum brasilense]|uniref:DUF6572 domain-containing protein n=2 Tax=Pseudomonadota TaxID=1224 RepID=UPI001B3BB0DE
DKETGEVRLSIVDHLHWDAEHLCLLQKKINGYLDFIVSGGIYASYPDAKGRPTGHRCVHEVPPNGGRGTLSAGLDEHRRYGATLARV